MYIYIHICICIYIYTYICIHINRKKLQPPAQLLNSELLTYTYYTSPIPNIVWCMACKRAKGASGGGGRILRNSRVIVLKSCG